MITKTRYFKIVEDITDGYYKIGIQDYEKFPMNTRTGGSYNLAPARVLGINYAEYLRFLLTMFPNDVKVIGKGKGYPYAIWRKGEALTNFVRLLNGKLTLALTQMSSEEK